MNRHHRRETGTQPALQRMVRIEHNLHRDSLDDLGEVTGRVVRRQKGKLRSAGGGDLCHFPVQHYSGKGVDPDVGGISLSDVGELRLLIVRLDPDVAPDQVDDLHARSDQLPLLHMTFADRPCRGGAIRVYPRLTSATMIAACFA